MDPSNKKAEEAKVNSSSPSQEKTFSTPTKVVPLTSELEILSPEELNAKNM